MLSELSELKLEDLVSDCPECRGRGIVKKTSGGAFIQSSQDIDCPTCNGERLLLTDAGRVLAAFVQKLHSVRAVR